MEQLAAAAILLARLFGGATGLATEFGPTAADPVSNPNDELYCRPGRRIDNQMRVVAHPTIPCHTQVWLYLPRTGRSVVARVEDRGPVHAMIDLGPATARALDFNGKEQIWVVRLDGLPIEPAPPRPRKKKIRKVVQATESGDHACHDQSTTGTSRDHLCGLWPTDLGAGWPSVRAIAVTTISRR